MAGFTAVFISITFVRDFFETGKTETEAYYKKGKLAVLRQFDISGILKKEEKY